MSDPDGLEQRTADLEEYFYDELDRCEITEPDYDDDLIHIAEERIASLGRDKNDIA